MTCEMWQNKLDPYLDSELPERELAEVESHLHTCTSCAADALGRLQLKRMMQAAAARYSPTPEFRLRIEQSIRAKSRWSFGWIAQLATATAVLLAIVGAAALWMRHSAREQALTELADLHVTTLASTNPVDVISTDRHTVKPWFAGKLPFTFNLPELAGSPFTLVGGRMVYFEHNPGAELLFALRKHHLSVFIFQENAGVISGNASPTTARRLAFNMETWTESGLRYVVISDASASEVHQLSELLRRA